MAELQAGVAESASVRDRSARLVAPALTELPPRDASALVRSVVERLRTAITFGELPPESRLNQVQLAAQLGVSRMPVRAALTELQAEGLIDPLPGGGAVVRALTKADLQNVYEVRTALESQAVRHVADRDAGEAAPDIDVIFQVLADHAALGGSSDPVALLQLDRRFHMAVLDATGNPVFREALVPIWSRVERAMVGMLTSIPDMFEQAWREHQAIAEALRDGDADLAEARTKAHLQFAAAQLARSMPHSA